MSFDSNISEKLDENEEEEDDIAIPEESVVGKHLSELTIRRVIMLVLGMMFGLPLFSTSLYYETNTSY